MIDVHTHILPPEIIAAEGDFRKRDRHFDSLAGSSVNRYATACDLIEQMADTGVSISVTFGFAFADPGLCAEVNDYIAETVKQYPERLVGFMCVQPADPGLEREVSRCISNGLRGIGELFPDGQGFSLRGGLSRVAGICREAGLPLLVHVNEQVGHAYPGKGSQGPEEAFGFAQANPDLRICFAHWGGGLFVYELMPEVRSVLANVFYDTAASPFLYEPAVYRAASVSGCIHKVLFGSDYPLLSPRRYFKQMDSLPLPEEDARMVLETNARRFLGIP